MNTGFLRHVQFFAALWTVACQAPLSMGLSRQEYRSGLPFPPPGDLPHPGIKSAPPVCPAFEAGSLPLTPPEKPHILHIWMTLRQWEQSDINRNNTNTHS